MKLKSWKVSRQAFTRVKFNFPKTLKNKEIRSNWLWFKYRYMNVLQHTRNERNPCRKQNRPDRSYRDTLWNVQKLKQLCPAAKKPLLLPEVSSCHNSVKFFNETLIFYFTFYLFEPQWLSSAVSWVCFELYFSLKPRINTYERTQPKQGFTIKGKRHMRETAIPLNTASATILPVFAF